MYYKVSDNGHLHYVCDNDGFILKVFISKEQCYKYMRDNK